jgi:hypothetical protein
MTLISYYSGNIKDSVPRGRTTLERLIKGIQRPKPHIMRQLELLKNERDPEKRTEIKHSLFQFTPAVTIKEGFGRKYANIEAFTGLLPLDFDKLPDEQFARELKQALFDTYPFIVAAWLSSSGKGVRAFVKIPVVKEVGQYVLHYNAIEREMKDLRGFDTAVKNAVLPLFISHDPLILYRDLPETETFADTYIKPRPKPRPYTPTLTGQDKTRHFSQITSAFRKIADNGHPQLRAASAVAGGKVGAGYISHMEAMQHIEGLIRSNPYLSAYGEAKIQIYLRTAQEMVRKGSLSPLYN